MEQRREGPRQIKSQKRKQEDNDWSTKNEDANEYPNKVNKGCISEHFKSNIYQSEEETALC